MDIEEITGKEFLEHTKDIHIPSDELAQMEIDIAEAFEQIEDFPEVNLDE